MEVLDKLQLTQYQALFHRRRIAGSQLVVMGEYELTQLGVHPGEHCSKLMNLITGYTSTQVLLED